MEKLCKVRTRRERTGRLQAQREMVCLVAEEPLISLPHFPALTFPALPIPKRSHAEQGTAPPAPHGCAVQLHGRVRNAPCPLSPTPSLSPVPPRWPRCPQSRIYVMRGRERCVRRIPELSSQPLQTHFYLPKCGSSAPSMKAAEPAEAVG